LLTAFIVINVGQAFYLCTILSALSCVAAATRLVFLASARQYRPFLGLLATWFTVCVLTIFVPLSSRLYFQVYVLIIPISWFLYLFVARDLYQKIFDNYRGIAFAGRWCLYISGVFLVAGGVASVWFSPARLSSSFMFAAITVIDRSILFGLAFFLVMLVIVIVRYPISFQKNLIVHTLVFSAILLCQALLQAADQWTGYHRSTLWNALAAGLDTILVSAWATLISRAGETVNVRIRQHLKPELELHLLGQLDALNGILLRAARK
jgi:hypothetical protein